MDEGQHGVRNWSDCYLHVLVHMNGHLHVESYTLRKKATTHHVTTMLATSKNILFTGHTHLLTTDTSDPTLWLSPLPVLCDNQSVGSSVGLPVVSRWLWPGNGMFLEVAIAWWLPVCSHTNGSAQTCVVYIIKIQRSHLYLFIELFLKDFFSLLRTITVGWPYTCAYIYRPVIPMSWILYIWDCPYATTLTLKLLVWLDGSLTVTVA